MAKTIAQIRKEIALQKKRLAKETKIIESIAERQRLSRELFALRNRKIIGVGAKAKRLSKKFGKGLLKAGQKAAPVIQKQARLIREQQLRDEAIAKAREKKTKAKTPTKSLTKLVPVKSKGKKKLFKKIKIRSITKKTKKKEPKAPRLFEPLDF